MEVSTEQSQAALSVLDTCGHRSLILWATFDHLLPVRCDACGAPFALNEAIAHVRALDGWPNGSLRRPRIYVNYATASWVDETSGESCLDIPDLQVSVRQPELALAQDQCMEAIAWRLIERAEQGLAPPPPRTVSALLEVHPHLGQWEWHWTSVAVSHYLSTMGPLPD